MALVEHDGNEGITFEGDKDKEEEKEDKKKINMEEIFDKDMKKYERMLNKKMIVLNDYKERIKILMNKDIPELKAEIRRKVRAKELYLGINQPTDIKKTDDIESEDEKDVDNDADKNEEDEENEEVSEVNGGENDNVTN